MTIFVIWDSEGNEILEGIFDGVMIGVIVFYDLKVQKNLCIGSVYIVKLKMYGLQEVVFVNKLFICIETMFGMVLNILKMGIMDEECWILLNLCSCIVQVCNCVVFINIGFFDCIGDEMYLVMEVGLMLCKNQMKLMFWIKVYECNNVFFGLFCGLCGKV